MKLRAVKRKKKSRKPKNLRFFLFKVFIGIILFSLVGFIFAKIFPRPEQPDSIISENSSVTDKSEYWKDSKGTSAQDIEYEKDQSVYKSSFLDEYSSFGISPSVAKISKNGWNLLLLNKKSLIPDNYELNLTEITGTSVKLEKEAAQAFNSMYLNASKENLTLTPYSGYRTIAAQRRMFENKLYELEIENTSDDSDSSYYDDSYYYGTYYEDETDAGETETEAVSEDIKTKILTLVSVPGGSCHNAGLSVDIISQDDSFAETDEYKWLTQNAADFGFVLRYPKDKEKITGMAFQPYCWRFVGIRAAKEMKEKNLCLEEYLNMV